MIAYEVLRIIDFKPLFALEHYQRLCNTILNKNKNIKLDYNTFILKIKHLIEKNNLQNGNLRIEIIFDNTSSDFEIKTLVIPYSYPSDYDYKNGVKTITHLHTREEPNFKIWNQNLRENIDSLIKTQNVYEIIYVNKNNFLSEGSRSNLFFIKDRKLISAKPEDILLGISRKYVIESAKSLGLDLVEMDIPLSEIENYDSAFISGTSPKVLPVRKINEIYFGSNNQYLRALMIEFEKKINADILNFQF